MSTLGSRIKESRESKKMLQSDLAVAVGVKSSAVISNWEKDINKPDADKIVKLCSILDVTASYLLDYYGAEDVNAAEDHLIIEFNIKGHEGLQKTDLLEFDLCPDWWSIGTSGRTLTVYHGSILLIGSLPL